MKFSVCNEMFGHAPFHEICHQVADLGYDGLEIAPYTLADSVHDLSPGDRTALRRMAEEHGLGVVGLHWLLIKPAGLHLTTPDDDLRERTVNYLLDLVDFCGDLGGQVMVCGSPKQRTVLDSYEAAWQRAVDAFSRLAERGAQRDVTVCVEPLAPTETDFIQNAAEAVRLIEQVDHPNCRLILDVKAMVGGEERPPDEVVRANAAYLAHFHANDPNLHGPGGGDFDHAALGQALRDIGYGGYVSVEVFRFEQEGYAIAEASRRALDRWYGGK